VKSNLDFAHDRPAPDGFSTDQLDRAMGTDNPAEADLVAIRKVSVATLVGLAILLFALWRQQAGSGVWMWIIMPSLVAVLGGTCVVFMFGLIAAVRRGAYLMIVLGIALTPFAFFVWAEILRRTGGRYTAEGEADEEYADQDCADQVCGDDAQARGVPTERRSWFERSD
jgi:hypothetical protein